MFNGEKTWDLSEKYVLIVWRQSHFLDAFVRSLAHSFSFYVINRFYGSNRHNKLDDLISDLTFFNGKCYACNFCNGDMNCPSNFSELTAKVRIQAHSYVTTTYDFNWQLVIHRSPNDIRVSAWTCGRACACACNSAASDWHTKIFQPINLFRERKKKKLWTLLSWLLLLLLLLSEIMKRAGVKPVNLELVSIVGFNFFLVWNL